MNSQVGKQERSALEAYRRRDCIERRTKRLCNLLWWEGLEVSGIRTDLRSTISINVEAVNRSASDSTARRSQCRTLVIQYLKLVGISGVISGSGQALSISIKLPRIPPTPEPRPVGRPGEDELRQLVAPLKQQGFTYNQIAKIVESETGISRTADAYRKLIRR